MPQFGQKWFRPAGGFRRGAYGSPQELQTAKPPDLAVVSSICIAKAPNRPFPVALATPLAARLLKVPVAIVSIVDADRIWFKSHHGLDVDQIDREPGLCASAILHDGPWLVNDARVD